MTPRPWEDIAPDPELVPFGALPAALQEDVAKALQDEVSAIAGPNPEQAAALQGVAMRAMPNVLRHRKSGDVFVGVETPRFPQDFEMSALGQVDSMLFHQSSFYRSVAVRRDVIMFDEFRTASIRRPLPLRQALEVLASDDSPERELAHRREAIAARIEAEKAAAERALAERTAFDREQERWARRNETQLGRWAQTSRLVQVLATAAEEHPALREFVTSVMELERVDRPLRLPAWLQAPEAPADDPLPGWASAAE